jgi:hypothetical protein
LTYFPFRSRVISQEIYQKWLPKLRHKKIKFIFSSINKTAALDLVQKIPSFSKKKLITQLDQKLNKKLKTNCSLDEDKLKEEEFDEEDKNDKNDDADNDDDEHDEHDDVGLGEKVRNDKDEVRE